MKTILAIALIAAPLLLAAATVPAHANAALQQGDALATTQPRDTHTSTTAADRLAYDVDFNGAHTAHAVSKG